MKLAISKTVTIATIFHKRLLIRFLALDFIVASSISLETISLSERWFSAPASETSSRQIRSFDYSSTYSFNLFKENVPGLIPRDAASYPLNFFNCSFMQTE